MYICIHVYIYILTCCSVAKSSYSQVDLTSLACPGPVALTHLPRLARQFPNEFDNFWVPVGSCVNDSGCPEGRFRFKIRRRRRP